MAAVTPAEHGPHRNRAIPALQCEAGQDHAPVGTIATCGLGCSAIRSLSGPALPNVDPRQSPAAPGDAQLCAVVAHGRCSLRARNDKAGDLPNTCVAGSGAVVHAVPAEAGVGAGAS